MPIHQSSFGEKLLSRRQRFLETRITNEIIGSTHNLSHARSVGSEVIEEPLPGLSLKDFHQRFPAFPLSLRIAPSDFKPSFQLSALLLPAKRSPLFQTVISQSDGRAILRGDAIAGIVFLVNHDGFCVMHNYPFVRRSAITGTRVDFRPYGKRRVQFCVESLADLLKNIPRNWASDDV